VRSLRSSKTCESQLCRIKSGGFSQSSGQDLLSRAVVERHLFRLSISLSELLVTNNGVVHAFKPVELFEDIETMNVDDGLIGSHRILPSHLVITVDLLGIIE
jgi:hypothetical protein